MPDNPLVSIVIPTYNQQETFLRECIESAVNQTYPNIEIIISDNHSTNGVPEIIAYYAQKDSRIRSIRPPEFMSMVGHFNFAYEHIRGEYICPLSSDDMLYPGIVEEQLTPFFTYPDLSFCYSVPLLFSTEISKAKWKAGGLETGFYSPEIFLEHYIKYRTCSFGGFLFKTTSFHKIGKFSDEYSFTGDIDKIIKLVLLEGGVYCINKPLSAIRQWERTEHVNRTPHVLAELAEIFDNMDKRLKGTRVTMNKKITDDAKRKVFSLEVYPIAYFTIFKKRDPVIIEKTAVVIKENYPKGLYNFIVSNRKNIIGLFFSVVYLSLMKVKNVFKD